MSLERTAHQYIQLWNEKNPTARRAQIEELFAHDCTYTDPLASAAGRDGIDRLIAGVQTQFAALAFSLEGKVDAHHDIARFRWYARAGADQPAVIGFDVIRTEQGKIKQVFGFLDQVPDGVA